MNIAPKIQDTWTPSSIFRCPFTVLGFSDTMPKYNNVQNAIMFLEAMQPLTEGMRKAKNYWLKVRKQGPHNPQREEIRRQYPQEIEYVRKQLWIHYRVNCIENSISKGFSEIERVAAPIPAEFSNLSYYKQLEPNDIPSPSLEKHIKFFLNVIQQEEDDRNWTFSSEDLQLIEDRYPEKAIRLRQLLWERHQVLKEERFQIAEAQNNREIENRKFDLKIKAIGITLISVIAAATFAILALTLSLPLLFIPTSLSLCLGILTPTSYYLTRETN